MASAPYLVANGAIETTLSFEDDLTRSAMLRNVINAPEERNQLIYGRFEAHATANSSANFYSRLHPHKVVMDLDGTESAVFVNPLYIDDSSLSYLARRLSIYRVFWHMPLSGADAGKVHRMGDVHEDDPITSEDDRDDWVFQVRRGGNSGSGATRESSHQSTP